jgi:hypothetical protein
LPKGLPNIVFVEETLKDHLWETLKRLKTNNSNEKAAKWVTLQCDEILEYMKIINGHVPQNVLKKQQNIIECSPIFITPPPNFNLPFHD